MRRIDYIKAMTTRELAKAIIEYNITDEFCDGSCGNEEECLHETECCIKWLEEHDATFNEKAWSDKDD